MSTKNREVLELHYLSLVGKKTLEELANMGLSEAKARALVRSTARRLSIMRRRLVDDAGGPTPDWASSSTPHSIVALVLIGQWNGDDDGDKAIVAEVVGQPYEEIERDLTDLMTAKESPLTKVGTNGVLLHMKKRGMSSHQG